MNTIWMPKGLQRPARIVSWRAVAGGGGAVAEPVLDEPEVEAGTATATAEAAGDWLCRWCLNPVANETDRFAFEGKDEFTFANPEGIQFEIITFSRTPGCHEAGAPTLEHTWFAGHAWSFCQCDRCRQQLGWCYSGPHFFAGLIRDRLVRGECVRN